MLQRKLPLFLLAFLLALALSILCSCEALAAPSTSDTADLNFSVRDSCSGHAYFMQAAAREDGAFIIYSRNTAPTKEQPLTFKQVYIDIYDSNGVFLKELSFSSPFDLAIDLTDSHVHIYFQYSLLTYHLPSGELKLESLPTHAADTNQLFKTLRTEPFSCGKWEYRYVKKYGENIGLIRSSGSQEQTLAVFPGSMRPFWKTWPPMMLLCIGFIIAFPHLKKKFVNKK